MGWHWQWHWQWYWHRYSYQRSLTWCCVLYTLPHCIHSSIIASSWELSRLSTMEFDILAISPYLSSPVPARNSASAILDAKFTVKPRSQPYQSVLWEGLAYQSTYRNSHSHYRYATVTANGSASATGSRTLSRTCHFLATDLLCRCQLHCQCQLRLRRQSATIDVWWVEAGLTISRLTV